MMTLNNIKKDIQECVRETGVNSFPLDAMPGLIRDIVLDTNLSLNFPIDFTSVSILSAVSMAIGNTYKVEFKRGHEANAILWCALVGSSGANKTHPMNFALRPIIEKDAESVEAFNRRQKEYKEYQSLDRDAKKAYGNIDQPIFKKTILADYTIEALGSIHDVNRRGIGVFRDEISGWVRNFSKYNSGSEVETWLTLWNGDPLIVDRKQGDKIFIGNSFVSVLGSIQPLILNELAKHGGDANGFVARILFAFPEDQNRIAWNDDHMKESTITTYRSIIDKLFTIPEDSRSILKFEQSAKKILMEWQSSINDRVNDAPESMKVPLSKIDTYGLRLCLILQMLRYACNETGKEVIEATTVENAIKIAEYFCHNSIKVHGYLHNTPLDRLPETIRAWYDRLPERFTTSIAKELAEKLALPGLSSRNVHNLLERTDLFKKLWHGNYKKQYA